MQTRVQKWGNSLALRIPKAFADEVRITEDSPVELTLVDGKLVLTPVRPVGRPRPPRKRMADLLAGITEENRHGEQDFGGPVGEEAL